MESIYYYNFQKFNKVAQIRLVPTKKKPNKGLNDNDMSDQYAHTASHMKKRDLTQIDHNASLKLQNLPYDDPYQEKVQNQHQIRHSQHYLRSAQNISTQYNYQSISKIIPYDSSPQKQKPSQYFSQSSSNSKRSYRSTTNEEIMSKYDIKQIMKRKHQKQEQKWKNWKLAGKILLIILLVPFSLIYLLISHLRKKHEQKQQMNKPRKQQKQQKKLKKQVQRRQKVQKSGLARCCDKFQACCQDYFCYYLCCQCCEDCRCCTRCCLRLERCSQCLCQNSLSEGIQDCFSRCCVRNCEKCCRFICCHNRTHEKLDTLDRLQRMSQKSRDRISLY